MKKRIRVLSKGLAVILVLCVIAAAGAGILEAGICWDAFKRCVEDPDNFINLGGPVICLSGWLFCLKYIEPLG